MKNVQITTTNEAKNQYWEQQEILAEKVENAMGVINVLPDVKYQTFRGFGGAFTEAAAHVYAKMSRGKQQSIIEDYYGAEGLRYNMGRIHMNSCDFALGNYAYIKDGDEKLESFDMSHDDKEIIPMIKAATKAAGKEISLLMSPWSPPAFMKTNGEMNNGGKLKTEYQKVWADYFVKFIQECKKRNLKIDYLTVQNEPMAVQTWDSCIYTAEEEGLFVRDYLGPALEKAGLSEVGIFVWDHNKEEAYQRFKEVLFDEDVSKNVKGEALHWYTGDHFEAIEAVQKMYPDKEIFFTEGCVEYSRFADSGEVQKAEMYAHDILGNLNAGITASLDWNLLLNQEGGPNHVGNFCAAPIMCAPETDTYEKRLSYYYIGHFSRYIKEGAERICVTRYTDGIETTAFLNPDGTRVIILLNKTDKAVEYTLREKAEGDGYTGICGRIEAHSIQTICY